MGGFNAETQERVATGPLPDGWYFVEVEKADLKTTDQGAGQGINVKFNVLGEVETGEFQNRKAFEFYNIVHSNQMAVKIGRGKFADLCLAVGVVSPRDTSELLNKRLKIRVGKDSRDKENNRVNEYAPAQSAPAAPVATPTAPDPQPPQQPAQPVQQPSQPQSGMPWMGGNA